MPLFRTYNPGTDLAAVRRIWIEAGWLEADKPEHMDCALECSRARVAELNGQAECLVLTAPATLRYQHEDMPMSAVTGVTTSRVARKQGLAGRLTARTLAEDVADGVMVSGLGMFEQGYYDRLGYGTGAYTVRVAFDPSTMKVDGATRVARRLTRDDWKLVHESRLERLRRHGACTLLPAGVTRFDLMMARNGFGLGFTDGPDGELTHHLWIGVREDVEHGPYSVWWLSYRTYEQLLELLGLLKNLGDQVRAVRMAEPPGIQMQDFMHRPFERWSVTRKGDFDSRSVAHASFQFRICDVRGCLERTRLGRGPVTFNLQLSDPIERYLPDGGPWRGVSGDYVVTLGESSGAESGTDPARPTLEASVGAFTRLWLGVRPASGLAVSDDLSAPPALLEQLDDVLQLPVPHPDWDF